MQKELFGTADCRVDSEMGTGMIPRDNIEFEQGMVKDGARIRSCFIRHADGGYNTLHFYGSNNESNLMGQAVKFVWMDEEAPHGSLELYSQCVTRTATTDGFVMFTSTPEAGNTALNQMFDNDETGLLYLQSVSWDDCPHLTPEIQEKLLAGIPEWQHDMRTKGLPVIGTGAVFPFKDSEITIDPSEFDLYSNPRIQVIAGVDFGMTVDPSAIVYAAYDPDADMYYLFHESVLDESQEARTPKNISRTILESALPNIVINTPHDGGIKSANPEAKAKQMLKYGANVFPSQMINPIEYTGDIFGKKRSANDIITGLDIMNEMFRDGKLKVLSNMSSFIKEKSGYFYVPKNGGGVAFAGAEHTIDAARYALMGLLTNRGSTVAQASNANASQWNSSVQEFTNEHESFNDWTQTHDDNSFW